MILFTNESSRPADPRRSPVFQKLLKPVTVVTKGLKALLIRLIFIYFFCLWLCIKEISYMDVPYANGCPQGRSTGIHIREAELLRVYFCGTLHSCDQLLDYVWKFVSIKVKASAGDFKWRFSTRSQLCSSCTVNSTTLRRRTAIINAPDTSS